MKKKQRIAMLDPINNVAYSRSVRKNSTWYREDEELQALMDDKGLLPTRRYAIARYQGVMVAVMV